MLHSKPFEDRVENHRSDKIFYHSFHQGSYLGSYKQSDRYTNHIVLRKESHKFFEHDRCIKNKKPDIVYITRKKNQQVFFDRFLAQELLKYYRICLHWKCLFYYLTKLDEFFFWARMSCNDRKHHSGYDEFNGWSIWNVFRMTRNDANSYIPIGRNLHDHLPMESIQKSRISMTRIFNTIL